MKTRKLLATLVVAAMMAAIFLGGCAQSTTGASSQTTTSPAVSASPTTAPTDTAAQKPDISKFVNLTYIDVGDKGGDTDRIWEQINKKLKTDLNCSVDIECISWSDWSTKYPLIFASGESFDMVYTSNWAFYASEAVKGAFWELTTDKLKTDMPKTFSAVTPEQWTQAKVNGKIFMIPVTHTEFGDYKSVFLVRGDLMKKYGINKISSTDDMIKYWDDVLTNDPQIIPLALGNLDNGCFGPWVTNLFLTTSNYGANFFSNIYQQTFDVTDPANIKTIDMTSYNLEKYKLLNTFKKKGYWSKDATVQTDDCLTMFANGKSASALRIIGNINQLYGQVKAKNPEWDPQIVDVRPDLPAWLNPKTNDGTAIHATSANPERAMMVLDTLGYTEDYFDLFNYGISGTDWTQNADGSVHNLNPSFSCSGGMGLATNLAKKPEVRAPNFDELFQKFSQTCITPKLAMMNFDTSKVENQVAAVTAVNAKYLLLLNLGFSDDVDGTYKEYMDALKNAGLPDIQAEYLKQAQVFMTTFGK